MRTCCLAMAAGFILGVATAPAQTGAGGVRIEFVAIPPGEFLMGCPPGETGCDDDEKPAHRVKITRPFEIGKYEVTQAQWKAVMGTDPSRFKGTDRPVEQVSWEEAQQFLARLNGRNDGYRYRLPTEAEWEYAARAGTAGKHYGALDAIAWHRSNSGEQTHPVGRKQPNAWGLYDMLGNVREWCADWYGREYKKGPAADPQGPPAGESRILRGGHWYAKPPFVYVSLREMSEPSGRGDLTGFRCAREKR